MLSLAATAGGNLDILEWLYGITFRSYIFEPEWLLLNAAFFDRLEIFQWLSIVIPHYKKFASTVLTRVIKARMKSPPPNFPLSIQAHTTLNVEWRSAVFTAKAGSTFSFKFPFTMAPCLENGDVWMVKRLLEDRAVHMDFTTFNGLLSSSRERVVRVICEALQLPPISIGKTMPPKKDGSTWFILDSDPLSTVAVYTSLTGVANSLGATLDFLQWCLNRDYVDLDALDYLQLLKRKSIPRAESILKSIVASRDPSINYNRLLKGLLVAGSDSLLEWMIPYGVYERIVARDVYDFRTHLRVPFLEHLVLSARLVTITPEFLEALLENNFFTVFMKLVPAEHPWPPGLTLDKIIRFKPTDPREIGDLVIHAASHGIFLIDENNASRIEDLSHGRRVALIEILAEKHHALLRSEIFLGHLLRLGSLAVLSVLVDKGGLKWTPARTLQSANDSVWEFVSYGLCSVAHSPLELMEVMLMVIKKHQNQLYCKLIAKNPLDYQLINQNPGALEAINSSFVMGGDEILLDLLSNGVQIDLRPIVLWAMGYNGDEEWDSSDMGTGSDEFVEIRESVLRVISPLEADFSWDAVMFEELVRLKAFDCAVFVFERLHYRNTLPTIPLLLESLVTLFLESKLFAVHPFYNQIFFCLKIRYDFKTGPSEGELSFAVDLQGPRASVKNLPSSELVVHLSSHSIPSFFSFIHVFCYEGGCPQLEP